MAAQIKSASRLWGEFEIKFTPLISFYTIVDRDMGLIKDILINYRNENVFDLKKDKKYFEILAEVYKRKEENPLYCLLKIDNVESRAFVDECYEEFITEREAEILSYAVTTDIYHLVRQFINSSEIIPTILYYTQAQKEVIDKDPLLSKIKSISIEELTNHPELKEQFEQFYFKYLEEAEMFWELKNRTFYFSTTARNLNDNNDDINISNEEVFEIYKKGNKINLFDIYRMDIIGGYNNNGSSE